jgi:hypothetical protein
LIDPSKIQEWSDMLCGERMLLLTSLDEDALDSAARSIQREPQFRDYQWRALYFGPWSTDAEFWNLLAPGLTYHTDTVVVVYALARGAERFLQNLPDELHLLDSVRDRLATQSKLLLILATDQSLKAAGRTELKSHRFSREVDFLTPLLLRDFPSTFHTVQDSYSQFEKVLPESRLQEFKARVHAGINKESFRKDCADLQNERERVTLLSELIGKAYRAVVAGAEPHAVEVDKLLDEEQPLKNSVLFVAAFFENLSIEDFQKTLATLLKGQTMTVPLSPASPQSGVLPQPTLAQTRPLLQIWVETRQRLMSECALKITSTRTVDFDETGGQPLRQEVQRAFVDQFPFLHDDLFQRVVASGLLFDSAEGISEGARDLVADRATRDPLYAKDCILECLRSGVNTLSLDLTPPRETGANISSLLTGLPNQKREHVFRRIGELLACMLDRGLDQLAEGAIARLVDLGMHTEALKLIRILWNHRQFSMLRVVLIRRLLDQGDKKTKCTAYRHICDSTSRGEGDVTRLLLNIFDWLPREGGLANSPSARLMLRLLVDLSEDALTNERNRAANPIAVSLTSPGADEFAGKAAAWLFHPELERILRYRARESWVGDVAEPAECDPIDDDAGGPIVRDEYTSRLIYGWILPRGYTWTPDSAFYIGVFFEALRHYEERLPKESRCLLGPAFRTLVLADCVLALAPPISEPPPTRLHGLHRFIEEVARHTDAQHRRHMLAHWHALAETMLEARAAANDPTFFPATPDGVVFRKKFAARLGTLRQVIRQTRRLFAEVGPKKEQ